MFFNIDATILLKLGNCVGSSSFALDYWVAVIFVFLLPFFLIWGMIETKKQKRTVGLAFQNNDADSVLDMIFKSGSYCHDIKERPFLFKKLAEMGNVLAMYNLGVTYLVGFGVSADEEYGLFWLRKAAEAGDGDAYFHLGNYYSKKGDFEEAFSYFSAGEDLSFKCRLRLARCFAEGLGVCVDKEYANILLSEVERPTKEPRNKYSSLDGAYVETFGSGESQRTYRVEEDF